MSSSLKKQKKVRFVISSKIGSKKITGIVITSYTIFKERLHDNEESNQKHWFFTFLITFFMIVLPFIENSV